MQRVSNAPRAGMPLATLHVDVSARETMIQELRPRLFGSRVDATRGDEPPAPRHGLPPTAYALLIASAAITSAFAAVIVPDTAPTAREWVLAAVLLGAAAVSHTFVVVTLRNQAYHSSLVFLVAGIVLLPPGLVLLIAVLQHVPEWIRERYAWYIQTFNIANYALSALAASGVYRFLGGDRAAGSFEFAAAMTAAAVLFVLLNHALLALMLRLARGHSVRETRLFAFDWLSTDLLLAAVGCLLAGALVWNPWFAAFALAPLVLIHRSLTVPRLLAEARTDAKTELGNARHFWEMLYENVDRARRLERPLSLLLIDLDFLRDVNNRHGHLAGDAVLREIAAILRTEVRSYDVPTRFGGEEFAVILPETSLDEAAAIAERIRRKVSERPIDVPTASLPINVGVSIGVAELPRDASDADDLVQAADVALYAAKAAGRNRVETLSDTQEPSD